MLGVGPWAMTPSQSFCVDCKSSPLSRARLLEWVSVDTFSVYYVMLLFLAQRASSQGQQEGFELRGSLCIHHGDRGVSPS